MADNEVNQDSIRGEQQQEQDEQVNSPPDVQEEVNPVEAPVAAPRDLPEEYEDALQPVHLVQHLQVQPRPHQLAWQYTQQFGIQAILWLQILWRVLSTVASATQTVSKGVIRSLQAQQYVFFERSNYPYRLQDYTLTGPGVASVDWYYDASKTLFVSSSLYNTTTDYNTHHLEWLTGQIRYNNLVLYDISDFLQQVKWAGNARPSAARVMAAWSLQSGIVLSGIDGITLQTINEDGTESVLQYHG
jgi:hypothetical protein